MTDIVPAGKPPIVILRERLLERRDELRAALTDIDPDHFVRVMVTAAQINPDLQAVNFSSLWLAAMRACRDGLLPDGREGSIVAFKSTATWIPGYQGLLKRFRRSGECKWITANVVRQGEIFEHWIDQGGEHFKHVPGVSDGVAPVELVYAAALTKDGAFYVSVLTMAEINKIKAESRTAREDSPWRKWPDEMMKKTALRRLSKLLPAGAPDEGEDKEELAPPQLTVVQDDPARPQGAAAALDAFAGSREDEPTLNLEPTETPESPIDDPIEIAFERGKIARQAGALRRAMPGEYREEGARPEAEAWLAGYDGKELPGDHEGS